ncbi:putative odorant receptor 85e [Zeugodacus cucurbitae]|uniref:putative odorant receptor 85e n=1 Tax=Zeugodacus cucurbitae TaxID=28588 RepID=UPI000596A5CC|nr:putative odorant receptor 85e [Zeugodacus cucurbitae]
MKDKTARDVRELESSTLLYSDEDKPRIADLFVAQVICFKATGQIPFNLGYGLGYVYCFFVITQTLHMAVLFLKTSYEMLLNGKLEEITDALTMTIIFWFSVYAACYWLLRWQRLLVFLRRINHHYWHHSLPGLSFVSSHRTFVLANRMSIVWTVACVAGTLLYGFAPLVMGVHVLPLKCWYPFDPLQPYVYELLYVLQLSAQMIMGATFGNGSALFVSLVILMCGQFDVLYCSLKNLSYYARLRSSFEVEKLRNEQAALPITSDDELNQYMYCQEHLTNLSTLQLLYTQQSAVTLPEALHMAVVQCVQLHRFILDACKELEELFNPYCLVKSIQVTFQLCLLVFVGVAGERSMVRILNLVQYVTLTFIELLMFTYFGELLRGHSVRCGEAFWRSQWWTHSVAIRKDIIILLANSKRAVRLTAGKFYAMDVERLRSVVTQAFSFLTLLQKLAAKNQK